MVRRLFHDILSLNETNSVLDLVTFCQRQGMPYTVFENWEYILATTKRILGGEVSAKQVAQEATA